MRVEVRIERLVVDGATFGGEDQEQAFCEALSGELAGLLGGPGRPVRWVPRAARSVVVPQSLPGSKDGGRPEAADIGRAVARSVHGALAPGAARAERGRP